MLVHWVHNPVDARILAYDSVLRVHQDNFEVLVSGILHKRKGTQRSLNYKCSKGNVDSNSSDFEPLVVIKMPVATDPIMNAERKLQLRNHYIGLSEERPRIILPTNVKLKYKSISTGISLEQVKVIIAGPPHILK